MCQLAEKIGYERVTVRGLCMEFGEPHPPEIQSTAHARGYSRAELLRSSIYGVAMSHPCGSLKATTCAITAATNHYHPLPPQTRSLVVINPS